MSSIIPIAIIAAFGGYAVAGSGSKKSSASSSAGGKNLYVVTDRQNGAEAVSRVQHGGAWVMVLPDAQRQAAVRTKTVALAKSNPGIGFVIFSARMVPPGSLPTGSWGAAEAIVDRQSLGVNLFTDSTWPDVLQGTLAAAIEASRALGAPPVGGLFQVTGVI